MRAQLSIDLLLAVALVSITLVGLVNIAQENIAGAKEMDGAAKVKVFAIDLRDTVAKVYAAGDGFAVKKTFPFKLDGGDYVVVYLNSTSKTVQVTARLGGNLYTTLQPLQVPLLADSSVTLTPSDPSLWVVCEYNETLGGRNVEVKKSP